MMKLTAAFTLLASLAFAGTAFAEHDDRVKVRDRRTPAPLQAPVYQRPPAAPAPIILQGPMRPAHVQWDLLATRITQARRGSITIAVPPRASLDELRLVASQAGLDIVAVELTYNRGRKEVIRPQHDGMVKLELGRGKLRSIEVRYVNRGYARGANIKVFGKDDARMAGRR